MNKISAYSNFTTLSLQFLLHCIIVVRVQALKWALQNVSEFSEDYSWTAILTQLIDMPVFPAIPAIAHSEEGYSIYSSGNISDFFYSISIFCWTVETLMDRTIYYQRVLCDQDSL